MKLYTFERGRYPHIEHTLEKELTSDVEATAYAKEYAYDHVWAVNAGENPQTVWSRPIVSTLVVPDPDIDHYFHEIEQKIKYARSGAPMGDIEGVIIVLKSKIEAKLAVTHRRALRAGRQEGLNEAATFCDEEATRQDITGTASGYVANKHAAVFLRQCASACRTLSDKIRDGHVK